jgi:protein-S-isoprenylcysteine O-methyltransferase Ste14
LQQIADKYKKEKIPMTRKTLQHIMGYLIGGLLFLIGIPCGLYQVSRSFDHLVGIQLIPISGLRLTIATLSLLVGLLFAFWSIVVQNMVGKGGPLEAATIEVSPKTQNLVVSGPYRYTRNPMLFGTCVYYYAVAIYLNSVIAIALVTLFMTLMLILVKRTEEPRLLKDFGSDYEEYRQQVSMFVPWRQRHQRSLKDR